jgi:ribose/xylose/arabinose/galactoside ABC-type transport system permease subunit
MPSTATDLPALQPARSFKLPRLQEAGLLVVIVLMGLVLSAKNGQLFLSPANLLGGIATPMATYAIMAIGVTCVIIAGGIDISVGAIFALAALGTAAVLQTFPEDAPWYTTIPTAIVVACGIGLLCGAINGSIVVALGVHPFIVTLGTMAIFRSIANVNVKLKTLPSPGRTLPESFTTDFMMYEIRPYLPLGPLLVMLLCVLAGWFYLSLTVAGRENYAIGGNEEAAKFSGLRVKLIKLRVYMISGLMAGIAGLVSVGYFGTASTNTGTGYELTVIASAVVGGASLTGGRGTALGALLGALVIKMIENGILVLKLNQEYSGMIIGTAIILAVAVDQFSERLRARRLAGAKKV